MNTVAEKKPRLTTSAMTPAPAERSAARQVCGFIAVSGST